MNTKEYIYCQDLVKRSFKLIVSVVNECDVLDLKIVLLLANTQAVKQIIEGKTFYSCRLFLML